MGPRQTAEGVAGAIVRAAARARPPAEVYPYALSRPLVWLNALSPRLMDAVTARMAARSGR
jgi:hypothetical protein